MKLKLRATENAGNTYEVETNLFVVVAWERKFKRKASTLADGVGAEDLAFLAWEACKQSSVPVPAVFDDYIKKLDNIEVVEVDEARPTLAEPTDEA